MSELRATSSVRVPAQRTALHDASLAGAGRVPLLPRSYIPRPRLWQQLDLATEGHGVTLLVAPAGAGKTLGVAGWFLERGAAEGSTWLSRAGELSVGQLDRLLGSRRPNAPRQPLVVIDDAHELGPACIGWLDEHLQADPERLNLVLLARWDLPLTRLVPELLGNLTVLRGDLLRLDPDESATLVSAHVRGASEELVRLITAHGQGWCAAVVLAARAVAVSADPVATAHTILRDPSAVDRVAREAFAALNPRQRHVLLCVSQVDAVSAGLARHLSNDPEADGVLDELEATGLLVTRQTIPVEPLPDPMVSRRLAAQRAAPERQATYQVHPLLAEVARRRIHAGGVDVERARATVRRAVELDVWRGELFDGLRRLLAVADHEQVVRLLSSDGLALVLASEPGAVHSFARHRSDLVEEAPSCWFAIALERWRSRDIVTARYWLHRVAAADGVHASAGENAPAPLHVVCARLMLALLGSGSLRTAVGAAGELMARPADQGDPGTGRWPDVALLELLVGMAQLRLGDCEAAEQSLSGVALHGPPIAQTLNAEALSQLALSEFLRGREHAVLKLATAAPSPLEDGQQKGALTGLRVAVELARLQRVVDPGRSAGRPIGSGPDAHPGDTVTRALSLLLESRRYMLRGLVAEADRVLDAGVAVGALAEPLRTTVLVEQALHAMLSLDRARLKALRTRLAGAGLVGEAAFVAGLRADLEGDLPQAIEELALAAEQATCRQPDVTALASACRAQLLAVVGHREAALAHLERAVVDTAVRRHALPFLGWSRHGTPTARLLQELVTRTATPWAQELAHTTSRRPGIAYVAGPHTATPQEREQVRDDVMRLDLSPRERDVLNELARGSTYSDIAANLFVSENTVKTHVSSLYAKLGVGRRSEALAVARTLRML